MIMTLDTPLRDIKLLRLPDQLHTTRSVTRTAEALGQSQPTVSIWLARARHPGIGGSAGLEPGRLPSRGAHRHLLGYRLPAAGQCDHRTAYAWNYRVCY